MKTTRTARANKECIHFLGFLAQDSTSSRGIEDLGPKLLEKWDLEQNGSISDFSKYQKRLRCCDLLFNETGMENRTCPKIEGLKSGHVYQESCEVALKNFVYRWTRFLAIGLGFAGIFRILQEVGVLLLFCKMSMLVRPGRKKTIFEKITSPGG